ncbi:MAG TPA: hypothetical protein VF214_03525 [Edaphobacter sp.]
MSALFEQPLLSVGDSRRFGAVKSAIEASFATGRIVEFLKSLDRLKLRIRDFESVLNATLLGASTASEYNQLGSSDQGQIRELYLASLEKVAPELRQRFFRLYSYY